MVRIGQLKIIKTMKAINTCISGLRKSVLNLCMAPSPFLLVVDAYYNPTLEELSYPFFLAWLRRTKTTYFPFQIIRKIPDGVKDQTNSPCSIDIVHYKEMIESKLDSLVFS